MIIYNNPEKLFHLKTKNTSYMVSVHESGHLLHLYWGKRVRHASPNRIVRTKKRAHDPQLFTHTRDVSLNGLQLEYSGYGQGDYRSCAYQIEQENGSRITELLYESYEIVSGKPEIKGLPSTYCIEEKEAETLIIRMKDELTNLTVELVYTVFDEYDVMTRHAVFKNGGEEALRINRAYSASVDFEENDFKLLHLSGTWAKERGIVKRDLAQGLHSVSSTRGASSHEHNPFLALVRPETTEHNGEVYGMNLVYSGNFSAEADVNEMYKVRLNMGINPFDFQWKLEAGNEFNTPEVVMVYSDKGLNGMSRIYHKLYRERLCRGEFKEKTRPILINNWEATYFDFNKETLVGIAEDAAEAGVELFVLDDGWFGKRDTADCSLGDWTPNNKKLGGTLKELVDDITDKGIKFGIWVEPEMISPDSELFRKHPDWCIHVPNRRKTQVRWQYILDLSRKEVCDYVIDSLTKLFDSADISYVKWDMNRHMTEIYSPSLSKDRQKETAHRYILGVYYILDKITSRFPNILFESCSGGGGRFDPGILHYMPQTWTSDDTDAIARLSIQYGTSLIYPQIAMAAHVSAVPNHQVGRITSLKMRGDVAMAANFGYELDLRKLSHEEREEVKEQIKFYKSIRELVQLGNMTRLKSPFEDNEVAWMISNDDLSEALVYHYTVLGYPNEEFRRLRLVGLNPEYDYEIVGTEQVLGGDELMGIGIEIPDQMGDFRSHIWHLREK